MVQTRVTTTPRVIVIGEIVLVITVVNNGLKINNEDTMMEIVLGLVILFIAAGFVSAIYVGWNAADNCK